ncbi:phosphoribosylglycinamide formyltransferase [Pontiella sulfatireligans]|uniref:Phosphoribosylglycinamide formyltransferase n=1 Tax=Pontiella sulfatireligans TaxID=2750658 RepID=A0A6C2UMM1_9BACT|nr:phosphoribosylglycinamide formyltransferase [Pontiella sulfatireligans]VGO20356.1 Phosphoribosylglycinamide formyltransferase [Pontiella sulfatireligans]
MLKLAIFGSGSGTNCQAIINAIEAGTLDAEIKCVLADSEDAYILERARQHNIPAIYFDCAPFKTKLDGEAEQKVLQTLTDHDVNFIALAGFMRIVKDGLLNAYAGRMINIHPSLLPSFPGLDSGKQAFDYGVKFTGCTVHFVDAGVDTGAVINQKCIAIENDDTLDSMMDKLHAQEHIAYPEALQWIAEGRIQLNGRRITLK